MKYWLSVNSGPALGTALAPQRPKPVREQAELPSHILEPAWEGTRVLVRCRVCEFLPYCNDRW